MNWFRSRIRFGARLALLALAAQIVLSFGHMHRDDLGLPPLPESGQSQVATATTPAHPANHDQNQNPAPDDYCPICASMALVAAALPSLPPMLVAPEVIRQEWPSPIPLHRPPASVALSFQARGPPAA